MSGASFELDMAEANYLFAAIKAAGRNLRPLMNEIGSALEDSTRQRFRTERSRMESAGHRSARSGAPRKQSAAWLRASSRCAAICSTACDTRPAATACP